ncbi:MAG: mannonate dehydratase [Treponema sp.]|nr:mannonate dehydratase [Treponema sp.]
MEMTLRWYGTGFDSVTLQQIRQVPGVKGVITTLYDSVPGDAWELGAIQKIKKEVNDAGLKIAGIESVNIHDDIKIGRGERDKYIENYIKTLERLGQEDIHMVCYNFMPVFDWTRTELARVREDGSTVLAYNSTFIDGVKPEDMFEKLDKNSNGFILPGWEPERMARVKELFKMYEGIDNEKLFQNLKYFLEAIMPVCDKYNIDMAIHPDDPAWPVFGLPRIVINQENVVRILKDVPNPHNGLTFCTGSYGTNRKNDLCEMIKAASGRIHFAHIRNLKFNTAIDDPVQDFQESAHLSSDGTFDMYKICETLYNTGFDGIIRPDHGRMIWGEKAMPGYGLYDRALGACYLQGLWEAIEKTHDRSGMKLYR